MLLSRPWGPGIFVFPVKCGQMRSVSWGGLFLRVYLRVSAWVFLRVGLFLRVFLRVGLRGPGYFVFPVRCGQMRSVSWGWAFSPGLSSGLSRGRACLRERFRVFLRGHCLSPGAFWAFWGVGELHLRRWYGGVMRLGKGQLSLVFWGARGLVGWGVICWGGVFVGGRSPPPQPSPLVGGDLGGAGGSPWTGEALALAVVGVRRGFRRCVRLQPAIRIQPGSVAGGGPMLRAGPAR